MEKGRKKQLNLDGIRRRVQRALIFPDYAFKPNSPPYLKLCLMVLLFFALTFMPNFKFGAVTPIVDRADIFTAQPGEKEILSARTENFKKFRLDDGSFRVAGSMGPIHYKLDPFDETEPFKDIDLTIQPATDQGWDFVMDKNGYQLKIANQRELNGTKMSDVARFIRDGQWLEMAPVELVYENDLGQKQVIGKVSISGAPVIDNENHTITWKNAFGEGIDFRYNLTPDKFFKTVIVNKAEALPTPTITKDGLKLSVVMALDWDEKVETANGFSQKGKTDKALVDPKEFSFQDSLDRNLWWMQEPLAWDSSTNQNLIDLDWKLSRHDNQVFATMSLDYPFIQSSIHPVYPLFIDTAITEEQVSASADDASNAGGSWPGAGNFSSNATSYMIGASNVVFYSTGVRFQTIPIPNGVDITSARLSFVAGGNDWTQLNTTIYGDDQDSAGAWVVTTHEPAGVTRTTASAGWNVGTTGWVMGSWYQSADFSTVVKEIIDRGGWVSGNNIAFVINNTSTSLPASAERRTFRSYDYGGTIPRFNATYRYNATGTTRTWDGGGGVDTNWSTAANWTADTVPIDGDAVVFDNTSDNNSTVDAGFTYSPASISMNAGYDGTVTQAVNLNVSGDVTVNSGTWAASTYDLNIADGFNSLTVGSTLTIDASATNGVIAHDVTISGSGAITCSGNSKMKVYGSWSNSGTFTDDTSTITFTNYGWTSSETLSGTLNGTSSFYKIAFNGLNGTWTINDSMLVDKDDGADDFVIGNGTVTYGNDGGETLELHGKMTIAATAGQIGTFQTTAVAETVSDITIQVNKDTDTTCANCILSAGATSGAGQGNLKIRKNTIVKLLPHNDAATLSDTGIETEATGYLEIQGSQDYSGTNKATDSIALRETKICDDLGWTNDENNDKVVRMTSGLAFGKIYDITDTIDADTDCATDTDESIVRADNTSVTDTNPTVSGSGQTRTLTLSDDTLITANNEGIGRYAHNLDDDTYYKIVDSAEAASDTLTIIAEPETDFSLFASGEDVEITDGVQAADTYEILDYATIHADSDTCEAANTDAYEAYIYSKTDSETVIRYSDICDMGRNLLYKYGVFQYTSVGTDANEGVTISKSKIHHGYYGIRNRFSTNNNAATSKGITDNAVYSNSQHGMYIDAFNNGLIENNSIYSNGTGADFIGSNNAVVNNNYIYENTGDGLVATNAAGNVIVSNNVVYRNGIGIYLGGYPNFYAFNNKSFGNTTGSVLLNTSYSKVFNNQIHNNGEGLYLRDSDFTSLTGNNIYGNSSGYYFNDYGVDGAKNNYSINDTLQNATNDIVQWSGTKAHTMYLYNDTLSATNEVSSLTNANEFVISRKHDGVSGATKIWNDYSVATDNAETPQNEALDKFNYADGSWENSFTPHGYSVGSGAGTEDSDLDYNIDTSFGGDNSVYNYYITCAITTCSTGTADAWNVYRNGTLLTNKAVTGSLYTDTQVDGGSAPNVQFQIDQGVTAHTKGATYTFTTWKASGDTNTTKTVTMMQDNDTFTVGSGKTLESKGDATHHTSWTRGGAAGTGYNILGAGTFELDYLDINYLKGPNGLDFSAGSALTSMDYTTFDNLISSGTSDTYIRVPSTVIEGGDKTLTNNTFSNTGSTAEYNVTRTGTSAGANYWKFSPYTGALGGEAYDSEASSPPTDHPGMVQWGYYYATLSTDKADYPTLGETISVSTQVNNDTASDLNNTTIDYVIFIDADADGTPDAGETYMYKTVTDCDTSGAWAAGNTTFQTTGVNVLATDHAHDSKSCANSAFPSIATYTVWSKWYDGATTVYDITYVTFTSVPTLGQVLFYVFLAIVLGLILRTIWLWRKKRQWLLYYLSAAFATSLAIILAARHFGLDQALVNLAAFHVNLLAKNLFHLPLELAANGRLILDMTENGRSVLKLGIECSAIIESSVFIGLILFYPAFGFGQKLLRTAFSLAITYVINIIRLLIIILMTYKLGPDYTFIAHAGAGRLFFFVAELLLYWYIFTKPTVKLVGDRVIARENNFATARVGYNLKLKHALGQLVMVLLIISLGVLTFFASRDWKKAFDKNIDQPTVLGTSLRQTPAPMESNLAKGETQNRRIDIASDQKLGLQLIEAKEPLKVEIYLNGKFKNRTFIKPEQKRADQKIDLFDMPLSVQKDDRLEIKLTNQGQNPATYFLEFVEK